MIITFGTQKGGVGKTTLAIALANYLAINTDFKINVYDFDFQSSLYKKWQEDKDLDFEPLYDVYPIQEKGLDFNLLEELKESSDINIVDLAGTLDEKYSDLLTYSDIIIIPFEYSDISLKATLVFINLLGLIGSEAERIFLKSKYDKGYNYILQDEVDKQLKIYGTLIEAPVYKRNCLQKINTYSLKYDIKKAVETPFLEIIEEIKETIQTAI